MRPLTFWRNGWRNSPRTRGLLDCWRNTRQKGTNLLTHEVGGCSSERSSKLVSIIIPHWNGIEILSECLNSLRACTYQDYEILVVDNASTDGSPDWVEKNHPNVKLILCNQNYGYAGGCNRGAKQATGEYLLFLNNDTIHEPDWIEPLISTFKVNPHIAAVQPKILNYFDRQLFDYAGGSGGAMDLLCFPFARGRIFLSQEKDTLQYDDETEIFWACGTAFLVKKDIFEKAGRFDETFFAHQEEIDLQWRMQLMGYKIAVNPKSVVYHKNAVTLPMHSHRKKYFNHRNSLIMLLSNYNLPLVLYLFPIRLFLEFVAIIYAGVLLDFSHIGAIIRSLFWIITHPLTIYRKRQKVKSLRKLNDRQFLSRFYKGSVVWDYYILRKQRYCDLIPSPS